LLQAYEDALAEGDEAVPGVIAKAFSFEPERTDAVTDRLAHYLKVMIGALDAQSFARLGRGEIFFPQPVVGGAPGDA
jgi:hypothetical protein